MIIILKNVKKKPIKLIHSIPNSATISYYFEGTLIWYDKNLLFVIS
jgi:hypothetical protein